MLRQLLLLVALGVLTCGCGAEWGQDAPPLYHPQRAVTGEIRVWGNDDMKALMRSWEEGFRKHHPSIRFETNLMGTDTAVAGLYTGVADVALMGRGIWPEEMMAFRWMHRGKHRPLVIEVATGSPRLPEKTAAVGVFVHRDNPLTRLTLAQVGAVFGGRRAGAEDLQRTWGDLGLTGSWSERPLHPYGYAISSEYGVFFRRAVLGDSHKWACSLREYDRDAHGGQTILDALSADPLGIAYSAVCYRNPAVKPVALAEHGGGPYIRPGRRTIADRTYPLARAVSICIDREPGQPPEPRIAELLRYVLSRDGQADVARTNEYLPLPSRIAAAQLENLEEHDEPSGGSG